MTQYNNKPHNNRHYILSPQAPPEVQPTLFASKPVTVLGVTPAKAAALAELGLYTLGDVEKHIAAGGELADASGIGPKTQDKYMAVYERYLHERVDYSKGPRR
jgi:hypothetical protein